MNELIKNSVDARKNAFFNTYNITDEKVKKDIEELFNKIDDFAKKYDDLTKFEADFANSSLNQDYINLFTTIASKFSANDFSNDSEISNNKSEVLDEIKSDAKYLVEDLTHPLRHEAREKFDSTLRDIPVVGDVIQTKQTMDLLNKYKKNSKED